MLLYGLPGMGKTKILQKFLRDHPSSFDETQGVSRINVIGIQMPPDADEKSLYEEVLGVEQGIEMREYSVCSGVGNPAIDFDKLNAFLWAQQSIGATFGKQVLKIFCHTKSPRGKVSLFLVPRSTPRVPAI
jgi:hypothetical protein